jgi:NAD(P)-dependent dehydrogenase (short-subunit alcohol dehydrogenase family)
MSMSEVTVVIGAGSIGQAIARRVSAGKQVLVADLRQGNPEVAAEGYRAMDERRAIKTLLRP